jgi:hypothetical protein
VDHHLSDAIILELLECDRLYICAWLIADPPTELDDSPVADVDAVMPVPERSTHT